MAHQKICAFCGKEYAGKTSRSMYCSVECNREADKKRKFDRHPARNRKCPICGKSIPKFKDKYCSDDCRAISNNGSLYSSKPVKRICIECGKEYIGSTHHPEQKYCSRKCNDKAKNKPMIGEDGLTPMERLRKSQAEAREQKAKQKQLEKEAKYEEYKKEYYKAAKNTDFEYVTAFKTCEECGELFFIYPYQFTQKYCSDKCSKKANRKNNSTHGRVKKRIKAKSQLVDKGITVRKLYERDNGICHICGEKCDYQDRKYVDGSDGRKAFVAGYKYPSIDHVIPLARGGNDSWDNVKLAHFRCNSLKSDKLIAIQEA